MYLVLPQQVGIPLSRVFTPLVMICTLDLLAFGDIFSYNASFHGFYPCFAETPFMGFQFRCVVIEMHPRVSVKAGGNRGGGGG